jgi:hypothetical protein
MKDVRRRQLLKLKLKPEKLNSIKYRFHKKEKCPICGGPLYQDCWTEDHWGTVERVEECRWANHYKLHWFYGSYENVVGFDYFYEPVSSEQIEKSIVDYRKHRHDLRSKIHRKTISQRRRLA